MQRKSHVDVNIKNSKICLRDSRDQTDGVRKEFHMKAGQILAGTLRFFMISVDSRQIRGKMKLNTMIIQLHVSVYLNSLI